MSRSENTPFAATILAIRDAAKPQYYLLKKYRKCIIEQIINGAVV